MTCKLIVWEQQCSLPRTREDRWTAFALRRYWSLSPTVRLHDLKQVQHLLKHSISTGAATIRTVAWQDLCNDESRMLQGTLNVPAWRVRPMNPVYFRFKID